MSDRRGHMRSPGRTTPLKVVILGDGGVGKSCLMHRFVSDRFDDQSFHTIGVEFLNGDVEVGGDRYTLQIWDTAGQERFRSLRTPFYRGTDVCMLTYAVDDKVSFDNLKTWMDEFKSYADVPDSIGSFPFLVVGNKSDRAVREVATEQLADWCSQYGISAYIETSAKTASNVKRAFRLAVERWIALEKMAEKDTRPLIDSVRLSAVSTKENSCCSNSCRRDVSI